ncbi:flavin reductase [Criibacterium bergeronii]|uniref:Flavin reductase n=1 Tax=Criibacterium bergeronii TaxID=1871336 RepID=A0A552VCJ0_9FIRM|nr:flavin reductase family protein [Criibacterium bergeronii]TRW28193.1 flavin reductase [Criibacterium bergeronii]
MDYAALEKMNYGVYIATAKEGDKLVGCTINAAVQITANPVTIAISINHDNFSHDIIERTKKFAISVLSEHSNPKIIGTFGFFSSKDKNKFENFEYQIVDDLPVLKDVSSYITCKVIGQLEAPTHTIFLGEVINAEVNPETGCEPMTYEYYHRVLRGKTSKKAATYVPPEQQK